MSDTPSGSESNVTRNGIENAKPAREAVVGQQGSRNVGPELREPGQPRLREERMVPRATFSPADSYYGKPILNGPVWHPTIPAYFFTGGLAAGSALLALGADLSGNDELRRVTRYAALGGVVVSTGFLIEDLGKPLRFHHMLRMAKLTSPMSVGSWVLAAFAPGAAGAALSEYTGRLRWLGRLAGTWSALLAPALGSYTAVLVADTAVPVWHADYEYLPFAFVGSAAAAAGGLAMATVSVPGARPGRRMAVLGAALEVAAIKVADRKLGEVGEVYGKGKARTWRAAWNVGTIGGLAAAAVLGGWRPTARVAGALLLVGSLAERLATYYAGIQSADDPKYVVRPQRERLAVHGPVQSGKPHITTADEAAPSIG